MSKTISGITYKDDGGKTHAIEFKDGIDITEANLNASLAPTKLEFFITMMHGHPAGKRKRVAAFCECLLIPTGPVPESALTLGGRLMSRYLVRRGLIHSGYSPDLGRYY